MDITVAGEINGEDVLKFSLPFKDSKRPFVQNEAKIQIVNDIYKIRTVTDEKASDGTSTTVVYAEAEFYDLGFSVYRPVKRLTIPLRLWLITTAVLHNPANPKLFETILSFAH